MKIFFAVLLVWMMAHSAFCLTKEQFGGNLKVSSDLLEHIQNQSLPDLAIPLNINQNKATFDMRGLNPDMRTELQQSLSALQDRMNACHWLVDFPNLDSSQNAQIEIGDDAIEITSQDEITVQELLKSPCLLPGKLDLIRPFRTTQYGYEANPQSPAGRPFLDSITPIVVDPINPYLSFKLGDVDVIPVPEDRFPQISNDSDLQLLQGPQVILYLKLTGFAPEAAAKVASSIDVHELARAVLNDHVHDLFSAPDAQPGAAVSAKFVNRSEASYKLLGDRLQVELQKMGFTLNDADTSGRSIELMQEEVRGDLLLSEYHILRVQFPDQNSGTWDAAWQNLIKSGRLIPLLIHTTKIAARKSIQGLNSEAGPNPDFENCWIRQ